MTVNFLQAYNGDCIHLSFRDQDGVKRNILIDGGVAKTYSCINKKKKLQFNALHELVSSIRNQDEKVDLLILTHVDDDHIGGILKWFQHDKNALNLIDKVWFNSGRIIKSYLEQNPSNEFDNSIELSTNDSIDTSIKQGVKFEDYLLTRDDIWSEELIKAGQKHSLFGIDFRILSPREENLEKLLYKWEKEMPDSLETSSKDDYHLTLAEHIVADEMFKEDLSKHNGSSISFILTYQEKNMLFLGDGFPSTILKTLNEFQYSSSNPIKCEFVKLSHHGSSGNTSSELLKAIDSKKYVISTNGDRHSHPHKKTISRLINYHTNCEIGFNYPKLIDKVIKYQDKVDFPDFKTSDLTKVKTVIK